MTGGRTEAELWATLAALTGQPLPGHARRLLAEHPDVAAAADPPLDRPATVVEVDREGRPSAPAEAAGGALGTLAEARVALSLPAAGRWREWSVTF
ncbi:MAG TPA: hypothetical protein VGL23_02695, partial [Chloroflexota bacterium]